jgi:bifunctional non-homologous end joining protein LigD
VPVHVVGDGEALLDVAKQRHLEGLMAKRLDSRYEPGRRSQAWRKVKIRGEQELVVGGWSAGQGNRSGVFGSLLLGYHHPDDPNGPLVYAGNVGTGFSAAELSRLQAQLDARASDVCPFAPAPPRQIARVSRWVRPELVAEVTFTEWTPDGRLRHPAYLGLRTDKLPEDVVREDV